jgi:hypothetical protein
MAAYITEHLDKAFGALTDHLAASPGSMAEESDWEVWGKKWVSLKVSQRSVRVWQVAKGH